MGYFSNGEDHERYYEEFCSHCQHASEDNACAVEQAHWLFNYSECNNKESILHILIPRDEQGYNEQCLMFIKRNKHAVTAKDGTRYRNIGSYIDSGT